MIELAGLDGLLSGGTGGAAGFLITFFLMRSKQGDLEKRLDKVEEWQERHGNESSNARSSYDRQLADLHARQSVSEERTGSMMKTLDEIKGAVNKLLERRRNREDNLD